MQYSIASGSCGCCARSLRASSGLASATSFSFATTSYISPLFKPLSVIATALLPAAPPPADAADPSIVIIPPPTPDGCPPPPAIIIVIEGFIIGLLLSS
jgi:hypothetical protein